MMTPESLQSPRFPALPILPVAFTASATTIFFDIMPILPSVSGRDKSKLYTLPRNKLSATDFQLILPHISRRALGRCN
jgi:hypothetical protein